MKRPGWIVGVVLLITAGVLIHTGWLGSHTSAAAPVSRVSPEVVPEDSDCLHSTASWRYRHHQSTSWRASLLQP